MRLRNEEHNTLTVTPYNVARQLYTVYQSTPDWNAETALQAVAHSTLKHIPHNAQGCVDALNYLNNKLEAVRKTISFWDAYQITDAIEDNELLLNKITQLPNNSSLVNNTAEPFQWLDPNTGEEVTVLKGDVFIKDYLGNIHLVHATNKGVYVPEKITLVGSGNSLSITYRYRNAGPTDKPVKIEIEDSHFNLNKDSAYNQRGRIQSGGYVEFAVKTGPTGAVSPSGSLIIVPIVKFFSDDGDQVVQETSFSGPFGPTGSTYWRIDNETTIPLNYEVR